MKIFAKKELEIILISSSLHYSFIKSYLPGLNRRPPPYQGDALPTELKQRFLGKKKELRQ